MKDFEFWQSLRGIARTDDSIDPPEKAVRAALDIFKPRKKSTVRFFTLQPSFAGLVRRGGGGKLVYELDEQHFVQMESSKEEEGFRVAGFASGVDETEVLLFGVESVFKANIVDGEFEFNDLPPGCYDMAFVCEGESLWIPNLMLEEAGA